MAAKRNSNRCTSNKACTICGKRGEARLNGQAWLCGEHAREMVLLSLMCGVPVVEATRGEPQYLLMPTSRINQN